ncbi:MAG: hypothetical protein LBH15_03925, partial [Treponema sp.]|nr:hypothetical protein [Treponema sp.]
FSDKAQKLRNAIVEDGRFSKAVNFEQYQVFNDASITSGVFIFNREHSGIKAAVFKEKSCSVDTVVDFMNNDKNYFSVTLKPDTVFALVDEGLAKLNRKIDGYQAENGPHPLLRDVFMVGKGMETAANDVFLFREYPAQFPAEYIKKRLVGENISPYYLEDKPGYLLYFENVADFKDLPESIQNHLKANRKILQKRATVKNEGRIWWRYSRPMHKEYYRLPKIWCSYRSKSNAFVLDESNDYIGLTNTTVIFGTNQNLSLKYLTALLNSKLFRWRYRSLAKQTGGGVFEYVPNALGRFPVPAFDPANAADKTAHDNFAALVDKIMELKKREHAEPNPQLKTALSRQAGAVEKRIDEAVYKLYGLTEEEIEAVEKA